MSGLLFLTTADFHIENGVKGSLLCHNISGFSLILFYSMQCEYCQKLLPDFRKLPGLIGGCQFGMLNIIKNKDIISAASKTIAPLEYVPFIILYANGKPFMKYEGAHDVQSIRNFINYYWSKENIKKRYKFSYRVFRRTILGKYS